MASDDNGAVRLTDGSRHGGLRRAFWVTVILAVMLLTTLFFAVRMDGGRELVRQGLERKLGMGVQIERSRIGWPYVLVVEGLRSQAVDPAGAPLLRADEIRIALGLRTRWRVDIRRLQLLLLESPDDGGWRPGAFAWIGPLADGGLPGFSKASGALREKVRLTVRDGTVRWLNTEGEVTAALGGVHLQIQPVSVPSERLYYYDLTIYNMRDRGGASIQDVRGRWLASHDRPYLELEAEHAPARGAQPAAPTGAGDGQSVQKEP